MKGVVLKMKEIYPKSCTVLLKLLYRKWEENHQDFIYIPKSALMKEFSQKKPNIDDCLQILLDLYYISSRTMKLDDPSIIPDSHYSITSDGIEYIKSL